MYVLTGPPDDVTDVNISPNTTTACSLVVQWSAPFSHSVCDSVRYTVTISTKEGILITTDNTTMTNYTVTGLNNSTWYSVSVTASNNAGSSNSAGMSVMTNNYGKFVICIQACIHICMNYTQVYCEHLHTYVRSCIDCYIHH